MSVLDHAITLGDLLWMISSYLAWKMIFAFVSRLLYRRRLEYSPRESEAAKARGYHR